MKQAIRPVVVSRTILLSPGHAPGKEVEPDTPPLRRLAEEKQPLWQLDSSEVATEAADQPVSRLPDLLRLLQKVVIFTHRNKADSKKRNRYG